MRKLEAFFGVLIAIMALSFAVMFGETKPSGKELLIGNSRSDMLANAFVYFASLRCRRVYSVFFIFRFGGSKTELKDHQAGSRNCGLHYHAPQCFLALSASAVQED